MQGHQAQIYRELSERYETLTKRLAAVNKDIGLATEELERQVLQERRQELLDEREHIHQQMTELEQNDSPRPHPPDRKATIPKTVRNMAVEYDELTRMLYEIRSDVVIIKESLTRYEKRLAVIEERSRPGATELSGIPVHVIYVMVIGGIVALLLMALLSGQVRLPG